MASSRVPEEVVGDRSAATQELGRRPAGTPRGRRASNPRPALTFDGIKRIGKFELIRELARGGMGQVFLARDTRLGRKVAIKFLLHDDPDFAARFVIEARATARCTHENIITIFEVGEHAGLPFMVLEYLEGKTLSTLLEAQPAALHFAELMVSVVRALERAHEHAIVHRDLKPSNIFVTDRGVVKVLDFGVAKLFDTPAEVLDQRDALLPDAGCVTFSGSGTLVGTIPYMSPEQWGADAVDHQSDLWAVGIMFWRALARVHPAGTVSPEHLRAQLLDLDTPLPSLATRDPDLPRALTTIVDRCLAKRKDHRYRTASALLADLLAFLAPHGDRAPEDVCPYRGLAAFGEGDAKYFFGRSAEIRSALAQLEATPMVTVVGPSGVGKSSFVHAGLVPAIRALGGDWQVCVLRPGRVPLASLANALAALRPSSAPSLDSSESMSRVIARMADTPGLFGETLRDGFARSGRRVLIVVDQLEELFTLSEDDAQRKLFLSSLLGAADDPGAPVRVVLTMRADFLDRLASHRAVLSELTRGLFFLSTPDADHLREILVRPAELAGYRFESATLVDDMLAAAGGRGALPLIQFAATRWWEGRDVANRVLTRAAFERMGGVGGAFARHADEIASAMPAASQPILRAIVTRLVTPEGTRAVIDHGELLDIHPDRGEVDRILDQLVRGRLISIHADPSAGKTVELVHEVLITAWPTLVRWLDDNHAVRGFTHEVRIAARQWHARGRPVDLLWRGAMAHEAIAIARRHPLELARGERAFLDAVIGLAARTRRRRMVMLASAFAVLAAVIAGGSVAVVRIASAEQRAKHEAATAATEARKARDAELRVVQQLADVREAQAKVEVERGKAVAAGRVVAQTREELITANAELEAALAVAQRDRQRAVESAKQAASAAEQARGASSQAIAARQQLATQLAKEQARNAELEKNVRDIARSLKP